MKRAVPRHFRSLWCGFFIWKAWWRTKAALLNVFYSAFCFFHIFLRGMIWVRSQGESRTVNVWKYIPVSNLRFEVLWLEQKNRRGLCMLEHHKLVQGVRGTLYAYERIRHRRRWQYTTFSPLFQGVWKFFTSAPYQKYNVDVEIRSSRCGITYM